MSDNRLTLPELAELTGLPMSTLRYYEDRGVLRPDESSNGGSRRYGPRQVDWARLLKGFRVTGMPLDEVRAIVQLESQGPETWRAREVLLLSHKRRVTAMLELLREHLDELDRQIENGRGRDR